MKPRKPIESLILTLRGQRVILDADLAELYGVQTKAFNQAVKRNGDRFPQDFMFQLTVREWSSLKSQIATSSLEVPQNESVVPNWSQFVTSSKRHRGAAYRPTAFTEHGAIMAATILNGPEAVAMSIFVVRAFIQMREQLATNAAILKRLAEIDKTLLQHNRFWNRPPKNPAVASASIATTNNPSPYPAGTIPSNTPPIQKKARVR